MKLFSQRLPKNSEQNLNEPAQTAPSLVIGQNEQQNQSVDQPENDNQGENEANEIDNSPVDYRLIEFIKLINFN